MNNPFILKICGLTQTDNIKALSSLPIDWFGFIFYEQSPRHITTQFNLSFRQKRVGVFVNATKDFIKEKIETYHLNFIQLHGDESIEFATEIQAIKPVIKAIPIADESDLALAKQFDEKVSYLLFDTKSKKSKGGTGTQFNWSILNQYHGNTPFVLSGGIGSNDVEAIQQFNHPKCIGIDVNSKFETQPGRKDVKQLSSFTKSLNR